MTATVNRNRDQSKDEMVQVSRETLEEAIIRLKQIETELADLRRDLKR